MSDYDLIQWLRDKVAKRGKNEKMYRQLLEMATGDDPEPPEPELKPCPFCGGDDVLTRTSSVDHFIECRACQAEGSWRGDKQQAIDTWNRAGHEGVSVDKLREYREWLGSHATMEPKEVLKCFNKFNELFSDELGSE